MKFAAMALALVLIAGCASDTTQMEARRMIASGETQAGLDMLARAARENPRDQQLRFEWLRQRDLASSRFVIQGDNARAAGQLDEAAAAYRQALAIDAEQPRAKAGLESIAADRRHAALVKEADAWFAKQNYVEAETRLRTVLNENPGNHDARNLLRRVTEAKTTQSLIPPVLKSAIGKKVTLEFREANIRSVFEVIGRTTGINFVFDKEVRPDLKTTIAVRNTTVEDAIKLILLTSQLERKVLNDNTLLIYPNTPAKQKEYQELVVRSFYVGNVDVKAMMNLVRTVVKTRDVYIDEKLNLLVMKDTPEAIRLAEKLIETQDMADPEVTLEVEVLEVSSNRLKELGVRFPDRVSFQDPATVGVANSVMRARGPLVGFVATPAVVLNLRQQDGYANVLANPRIRVKNREKAKVHIGDRVPVITTTSTANVGVSASVNYLDVGLKLEVEPTIHLEGDVAIKVGLEVSNIVREVPTTGGGLAYQVGTRNAATVLRLRDGETQVLAGLIQDEERSTANRLPGVGDLPVVGRLFSSSLDTRGKTEIVLLITPRVVRNLARADHVKAEFYSGTESAVGAQPLVLGPTDPGSVSASGTPSPAGVGPLPGPVPPGTRLGPPATAPATLQLSAPSRAAPGSEITISVALLPHPSAATASAELVYDPSQLVPAAPDAAGANGRLPVQLAKSGSMARADVKFRVIGKASGRTEVSVQNAVGRDGAQSSVPVAAPPPAAIDLAP